MSRVYATNWKSDRSDFFPTNAWLPQIEYLRIYFVFRQTEYQRFTTSQWAKEATTYHRYEIIFGNTIILFHVTNSRCTKRNENMKEFSFNQWDVVLFTICTLHLLRICKTWHRNAYIVSLAINLYAHTVIPIAEVWGLGVREFISENYMPECCRTRFVVYWTIGKLTLIII